MTNEVKKFIQKYLLSALLLFVIAALLLTAQYFTNPSAEKALRDSASNVLASWTDKPPEIGERVKFESAGLSRTWTFEAKQKGRVNGLVFVTPVTGNSGPFTGVFYYTPNEGTRFCGIAGIPGHGTSPERYGLTPRILDSRIRQLDRVARKAGDEK